MDAYEIRLQAAVDQAMGVDQQQKPGDNRSGRHCLGMLAQLVRNSSALKSLALPRYVFDGQIEGKFPFSETLFKPDGVPGYLSGYEPVLTQFNLGPALVGAQPHFHGDAWNALVFGRAHSSSRNGIVTRVFSIRICLLRGFE